MNFLKGFAGGIGGVIPGLSGSVIFIILNIYEDCINSIYELMLLKNVKKNISFLLPIAVGIVIASIFLGNMIKLLIVKFPLLTTSAFFGLILGTVPSIYKEANRDGFRKKYIIPFIIALLLGVMITYIDSKYDFIQLSNPNTLHKILLGFLMCTGDVIPGISSTILLNIFGMYDIYINALAELDILFFIPVLLGFAIGFACLVILMKHLLKNFYGLTYYAILGFVIATVPTILRGKPGFDFLTLMSVFIAILAFSITHRLGKLQKAATK